MQTYKLVEYLQKVIPLGKFYGMNKKFIISIILILITIFLTSIIILHNLNTVRVIIHEDSVNLKANSVEREKGMVKINDSIYLEGNSDLILSLSTSSIKEQNPPLWRKGNYHPVLYDLMGPYEIYKKNYNDTLRVIKKSDTLYFLLINDIKLNNTDKSFSDLFRRLFN